MRKNRNAYPCLTCDLDKLAENLAALTERCHDSDIEIAGVVKGFTAHPEIVRVYEQSGVKFIATSRIDQLRAMREAGIGKKPLMLIRIPMLTELVDVVALSDISLQSDIDVLRATNEEAKKQGKVHDVIMMMDLGDLDEGFWSAEEAVSTAVEIETKLKNLHLVGVGVSLSRYGSVKPVRRNMQALVSLCADIEKAIGRPLDWVSGGASSSVYMALGGMMPYRINLLRIGEFALLGGIYGCYPDFTHKDVFTLRAEVIECRDKPSHPIGELMADASGETRTYVDRGIRRRALLAVGRADYGDTADIIPRMKGIEVLGASSDYTILDIEDVKNQIKVGDVLEFDVTYGSLVYLSNTESVRMEYKKNKQ